MDRADGSSSRKAFTQRARITALLTEMKELSKSKESRPSSLASRFQRIGRTAISQSHDGETPTRSEAKQYAIRRRKGAEDPFAGQIPV